MPSLTGFFLVSISIERTRRRTTRCEKGQLVIRCVGRERDESRKRNVTPVYHTARSVALGGVMVGFVHMDHVGTM
jgi:hypothetical protein